MKQTLITLMMLWGVCQAYAQNIKRPDSYNYKRGLEAVQQEKTQEALECFNKDIAENPKSGYPHMWVSYIYLTSEEYGRALDAANMAIKLLPKKDVEYLTFAYIYRSKTYLCLGDSVKAIEDYTSAIKIAPDNTDLYNDRAQIYYEQKRYDLADADYRKMTELKPGDVMGYMGLGRNANAQKRWDDAIRQFDYVTKLASEYSSGYSFRAESYLGLGKWNEATDDMVKAIGIDWDRKAFFMARTLKDPALTMIISKMKVQAVKSPNEPRWPYYIGMLYEANEQFSKAIAQYSEANKKDESATGYNRISYCYYKLGDFEKALASINRALDMDSTDVDYISRKADVLYEMGEVEAAISEWSKVLVAEPEYAFGYYRRGWYKELAGDLEGAAEDMSMSIVLEPDYSYAYGTRGDIYAKLGKKDLAEADFKRVLELENTPEKYSYIHYAYQGLGLYDKAIAAMDSIIAREKDRAGSYYDAACLYSRMKDKVNALKYLTRSLELGYNRFAHMDKDYDLDFIRDSEEYKALVKKYRQQGDVKNDPIPIGGFDVIAPQKITEVPFAKENGICLVKCLVNNLPLHFVFDTGASDVTLSMVEANFMFKNGYLSNKDVVGSQRYMDANGDVNVGTVINLRKVSFGGHELSNVRASVVRNQKAPLLLGQSVLSRLGKVEIDNGRSVLKITQNK